MAGERSGPPGHFDEEVKVIVEDAVGVEADATEAFAFAHQDEEAFLLRVNEDEASVDDAGNAVIGEDGRGPDPDRALAGGR